MRRANGEEAGRHEQSEVRNELLKDPIKPTEPAPDQMERRLG
jgi:hypothetical protein